LACLFPELNTVRIQVNNDTQIQTKTCDQAKTEQRPGTKKPAAPDELHRRSNNCARALRQNASSRRNGIGLKPGRRGGCGI
jgi:hypothetical protein